MSNLIKYQFVSLDGKDAVLIDNNKKKQDGFKPLQDDSLKIRTISQIEAEKALMMAQGISEAENREDGGFQAGIPVTDFDKMFQEQKEKAKSTADAIIEEAKLEAERIRNEALHGAEQAKNRGYEEGKQLGYEEGLGHAEQEIQQRERELSDMARQQKQELNECITAVEVKYVDVLIALVKKLTGVVLEEREDIILYLIQNTAKELELSNNYKIRVSADDLYFIESQKAELLQSFGDDVTLEFVEEKGLEKGQCIIETDTQMVDCGFQTQLSTLVRDLKMLVR